MHPVQSIASLKTQAAGAIVLDGDRHGVLSVLCHPYADVLSVGVANGVAETFLNASEEEVGEAKIGYANVPTIR